MSKVRLLLNGKTLKTDKISLSELAEKYKISAERIRQIEATAFKKLKTSLVNV